MEGVVNQGTVHSPISRDSAYVRSLEDEVNQLKQDLRTKQRKEDTVPETPEAAEHIADGNPAVQKVVKSLNATINSLRSEKIELTAAGRKQQIEIERLKAENNKLKMGPNAVLEAVGRSVAQARNLVDDVEWSPEDATRTEFEFLCKCIDAAIVAGATTLNIPDTVGYSPPEE